MITKGTKGFSTTKLTKLAFAIILLAALPLRAVDPDDPNARLIRLERWLKASLAHHPGERDDAVTEVSLWSTAELKVLRVDINVLVRVFRKAGMKVPAKVTDDRSIPPYTPWQRRQFELLAPEYYERNRHEAILVRGAVLHGDIAMSNPAPVFAPGSPTDTGHIKVSIGDGESLGFSSVPIHWETARMLFDLVKDTPSAFDVARRWYGATAMQMQYVKSHDTLHLKHARELFPEDVAILYLSGTQQETYAGPSIQAVVKTAVLPMGFHVDIASEAGALRNAEGFLRHALMLDPRHQEARLHLGHVLLAHGRPQEAADELRQVTFPDAARELRYFSALFLGAAEEGSGRFDQAREAYMRASTIVPGAQSPYVALSALAMRRGDRAGALKDIQRVFDLDATDDSDPWWAYDNSQARAIDEWLSSLYQIVAEFR